MKATKDRWSLLNDKLFRPVKWALSTLSVILTSALIVTLEATR